MSRPQHDPERPRGVKTSTGRGSSGISSAEAFDQMLCAAVTAVDSLDLIGQLVAEADVAAVALVDQLKASIAAEALSVMERWPS